MKRIIIAGAGHGGLVAAYHLAHKGYEVKVLESRKKEQLGHDWHDYLEIAAFDDGGIPRPDSSLYSVGTPSGFRNPAKTKLLRAPFNPDRVIVMDRKVLINYLADLACEAGVEICYGVKVCAAITEGEKVIGVRYEAEGETRLETCDLLIDAAGMHSPVRKSLPQSCGIEKEIAPRDIFDVYRVYFENTSGQELDPAYQIIFFNLGRPGIDWIHTKEGRVDLLFGKFNSSGELTEKEIEAALAKMREEYDFIGNEIIRGGIKAQIPVRRMLPVIVCDGYAAIGDSAGMTVPINGSGIVLAMQAGKILADTVLSAGETELTREILWKYEYEYFNKYGKDLLFVDVLKNLFTTMDASMVDFMIEEEILTEKEFAVADGAELEFTKDYILNLLGALAKKIKSVPKIAYNLKSLPFLDLVAGQMPESYDEKKVKEWARKYRAL